MSNYIDSPCRGCNERHVGCHDDCVAYKAYLNRHKRIMEHKNANEDIDDFLRERKRDSFYKVYRKYNR